MTIAPPLGHSPHQCRWLIPTTLCCGRRRRSGGTRWAAPRRESGRKAQPGRYPTGLRAPFWCCDARWLRAN